MDKEQELKAYEIFLRKLAVSNSKDRISNGGKDHAAVLYSVLLDKTDHEVRIFCQSGASAVWHDPRFEEAMCQFLANPDTSLKVLTAGAPALDEKWTNRNNVTAYHINNEDKEAIYCHFRNDHCNFAVFDSKRYRYEYDCEHFKAYGSFNDPETAREMIGLFDSAFHAAEQLAVAQ